MNTYIVGYKPCLTLSENSAFERALNADYDSAQYPGFWLITTDDSEPSVLSHLGKFLSKGDFLGVLKLPVVIPLGDLPLAA